MLKELISVAMLILVACSTLQGCEVEVDSSPKPRDETLPSPSTPGGDEPPTGVELPPDAEFITLTDPQNWFQQIQASNGGAFRLEAKTYYMTGQYELPANTKIYGAGSKKSSGTVVEVKGSYYDSICWGSAGNRKGFLLGDNTYIGHLYFKGMETKRFGDNQLLCGGAVFETPGCKGTGKWEYVPNDCGGDTGNNGNGVQGAVVEDIEIEEYTTQSVFYMAPTKPGAKVSQDITIRKVKTTGVWADGMNIHGAHQNVLIEDCDIQHCGDDIYAIWSTQPGANKITFRNNVGVDASYRRGGESELAAGWGYRNQFCFAIYGGQESKHVNNKCDEAKHPVSFGNYDHSTPLFGGKFTSSSKAHVEGLTDLSGRAHNDPCRYLDRFPGEKYCKGSR